MARTITAENEPNLPEKFKNMSPEDWQVVERIRKERIAKENVDSSLLKQGWNLVKLNKISAALFAAFTGISFIAGGPVTAAGTLGSLYGLKGISHLTHWLGDSFTARKAEKREHSPHEQKIIEMLKSFTPEQRIQFEEKMRLHFAKDIVDEPMLKKMWNVAKVSPHSLPFYALVTSGAFLSGGPVAAAGAAGTFYGISGAIKSIVEGIKYSTAKESLEEHEYKAQFAGDKTAVSPHREPPVLSEQSEGILTRMKKRIGGAVDSTKQKFGQIKQGLTGPSAQPQFAAA